MKQTSTEPVRLDKWLWAARFYKTRSIARDMIDGGKVHYNGQRTKPGKIVELNALIRLRQGNDERTVEVLEISSQRRGAPDAQLLYRETQESLEQRDKVAQARNMNALTMPHPERRPDKKERRTLLKFKQTNSHGSS
ncbi:MULTISPECIES: ribosome-associated heat shock protein Hsp15 [Providencia]|uniref:ribosome-associated heat shock protein Hsp15 n=1 Tax=Providencia TaxID=586 RepID=UPI0023490F67|nr:MULTISPECIES: ribosome-associated heat shock protein Hsp15 [Providencia]MDX4947350.1 ribosome-associated heat shock protein Hsp15 [Providencia manganoxydans]